MKLLAVSYIFVGRRICLLISTPVVLYFYLTDARRRAASLDYLKRVAAVRPGLVDPSLATGFRHYLAFAAAALDRFSAWLGHIDLDKTVGVVESGPFRAAEADAGGALVFVGHVGCPEVLRAITTLRNRRRVSIIAHSANAAKFMQMMARFAPRSMVRVVEIADLGVGEAIRLAACVDAGDWLVIAADRTPPGGGPTISAPFLGAPAQFPSGPFILANALRRPVYFLGCIRVGGKYRVTLKTLDVRFDAPRHERRHALKAQAAAFAQALEEQVLAAPLQWFNFYDFWAAPETSAGAGG